MKNDKVKPDIRLTFQEPTSYILERYDDYIIFARTLVNYLEMDHETMVIRNNKSEDKERMVVNAEEEATGDAISNEQHNTTNMTWDTGHTGKKDRENRRRESMEIFKITSSSRSSGSKNIPMFTMFGAA